MLRLAPLLAILTACASSGPPSPDAPTGSAHAAEPAEKTGKVERAPGAEPPGLVGAAPREEATGTARPAGSGTVTVPSIEVRAGPLTAENVRGPIEGARESLRVCLAEAAQTSPGLQGDLQVNMVVNAAGGLDTLGADPGPVEAALSGCVYRELMATRYPEAAGVTIVRVILTFGP